MTTLRLERVENDCLVYDISSKGEKYFIWRARVIPNYFGQEFVVVNGSLEPQEMKVVRELVTSDVREVDLTSSERRHQTMTAKSDLIQKIVDLALECDDANEKNLCVALLALARASTKLPTQAHKELLNTCVSAVNAVEFAVDQVSAELGERRRGKERE